MNNELKNLKDYKVGDKVEVYVLIFDKCEWRKGKVLKSRKVNPSGSSKFFPYTELLIEYNRTYFNSETQEKYNKTNQEWFSYKNEIRPLE